MGLYFFKQFFREPGSIGAIAPSSSSLTSRMLEQVDFTAAKVIVEYGPGTGVFTKKILESIDLETTTFFALEANEKLQIASQAKISEIPIYKASAAEVGRYLERHGHAHADAIVSGLPWAAFSEDLQDEILDATLASLAEGGTFATFAYLHGLLIASGQRFREKLKAHFSVVETSPIVWKNVPPAFVYWCRK